MTIRFDETEARAMGRNARGVNGIKLEGDDAVAGWSRPTRTMTGRC